MRQTLSGSGRCSNWIAHPVRGLRWAWILGAFVAMLCASCSNDDALSEIAAIEVLEKSAVDEPITVDELIEELALKVSQRPDFRNEVVEQVVQNPVVIDGVAKDLEAREQHPPVISNLTATVEKDQRCSASDAYSITLYFDYSDADGDVGDGASARVDVFVSGADYSSSRERYAFIPAGDGGETAVSGGCWTFNSALWLEFEVELYDQAGLRSNRGRASVPRP